MSWYDAQNHQLIIDCCCYQHELLSTPEVNVSSCHCNVAMTPIQPIYSALKKHQC